jgi:hypothetical protein
LFDDFSKRTARAKLAGFARPKKSGLAAMLCGLN